MKFRTTLILLVIGFAAALYFFLVERPRQENLDEIAAREESLTGISPDGVETLAIERPDLNLTARRDGAHWTILTPVEDSADDSALNTLIRSICDAAVERRIDTGGEGLSEFGLDPPAAVVRLGTRDRRLLLELRIGHHNVTKSHCYAAVRAAPTVLLIPAGVRRYALRPFFEYRNRRIVEVGIEEITGVGISSAGRSMMWRLDRSRESWFTVENGDTIPGDSTAVQAVVREIRGLRALDIPPDGAVKRDEYLKPAAGSIVLENAPATGTITLRFGAARDGACYVERSDGGRIARVDAAVLGIFERTVDEMRYRRLFRYSDEDLSKVTLETPARTITVVRSGARWSYANPGFGEIDEESASGLLRLLRETRFESVIEEKMPADKDYGFSRPFLRLVLFDPAGGVIDELRVGDAAPGDGSRYATSRSAPYLVSIARAPLSALEAFFGGPRRR